MLATELVNAMKACLLVNKSSKGPQADVRTSHVRGDPNQYFYATDGHCAVGFALQSPAGLSEDVAGCIQAADVKRIASCKKVPKSEIVSAGSGELGFCGLRAEYVSSTWNDMLTTMVTLRDRPVVKPRSTWSVSAKYMAIIPEILGLLGLDPEATFMTWRGSENCLVVTHAEDPRFFFLLMPRGNTSPFKEPGPEIRGLDEGLANVRTLVSEAELHPLAKTYDAIQAIDTMSASLNALVVHLEARRDILAGRARAALTEGT
jgi:hypothetical protein